MCLDEKSQEDEDQAEEQKNILCFPCEQLEASQVGQKLRIISRALLTSQPDFEPPWHFDGKNKFWVAKRRYEDPVPISD